MKSACIIFLRDPNATDGIRQPLLECIKMFSNFNSLHDTMSLFMTDIISFVSENSSNVLFRSTIETIISKCSPKLMEAVYQSQYLQKIFNVFSIEYVPKVDLRVFAEELDINDNLELTKRLCALFYLKQSTLPSEFSNTKLPLLETTRYMIYLLQNIPIEAEMILKRQTANQENDQKGKNSRKEISFSQFSAKSILLFRFLFILFKNMMKATQNKPPNDILQFVSNKLQEEIPRSIESEHPSLYAHHCLRQISLYSILRISDNKMVNSLVGQYFNIIVKDIQALSNLTEPNMITHVTGSYSLLKSQRIEMLKNLLIFNNNASEMIQYIACKMLNNATIFEVPMWTKLRDQLMYPIRIEAEAMFRIVIHQKSDISQSFAYIIENSNFLENERKLSDMPNNEPLVSSSLRIFNTIFSRSELFTQHFLKQCSAMKDSFTSRFNPTWIDVSFLDLLPPKKQSNNGRSHKNSGFKADSWKRPITTLDGKPSALVFAPGSKPVTIIQK